MEMLRQQGTGQGVAARDSSAGEGRSQENEKRFEPRSPNDTRQESLAGRTYQLGDSAYRFATFTPTVPMP
jgi:hypothetical protein